MTRRHLLRLAAAAALCFPRASPGAVPRDPDALGCLDNQDASGCNVDADFFATSQGVTTFPYQQRIDLGIPTGASPPEQLWVRATETGSVRAYASTGALGAAHRVAGNARLIWVGTYPRGASGTAGFTVNRSWVALLNARGLPVDQPPSTSALAEYFYEIIVVRDRDGAKLYDLNRAVALRGHDDQVRPPEILYDDASVDVAGLPGPRPDFRSSLVVIDAFSRRLESDPFHGTVPLDRLLPGETYTVWYALWVAAATVSPEEHAEAFLGDPFDASSGFQWEADTSPVEPEAARRRCHHPLDAGRWVVGADGTATDQYTGLMWQRCGAGRAFSAGPGTDLAGDRCPGSDLGLGWAQALQRGAADRLGGYADWRLPNAKELDSIVDLGCEAPSIESRIFPDTSPGLWWSSTPERTPGRSRMTSFLAGSTVSGIRSGQGLVRLVRDAGIATRDPLPRVSLGRPAPLPEGNAGQADLVFPVVLDRPASAAVTVEYRTADVSASAGQDYLAISGTLTIPPGSTRAELRVPVLGDLLAEPDEFLALELSNVSPNARLGATRQVGTIVDDEPRVSIGPASALEGNAGNTDLAFPVTLSAPAPVDVAVDWVTSDGTATAGSDYLAASGTLTIPAGQTSGTVHVSAIGDRLVEPDETLTVTLGAVSAGAWPRVTSGTGTIRNDDLPGPAVVDAGRYAGDMGGRGNADGAGAAGRLSSPTGIAGEIVADFGNGLLRTVALDGTLSTPLRTLVNAQAVAQGPGGEVYFTDRHQVRRLSAGALSDVAGAGTPGSADGQGGAARFSSPAGLAADAAGNVWVADTGNHTIRRIDPSGLVTTMAGTAGVRGSADGQGGAALFTSPVGIAVDPGSGTVYVGDGSARLRAVTAGGAVTTVAGSAVGQADSADPLQARFRSLDGLAVGPAGEIYVADGQNHAIRRVDARGVATFAGTMGLPGPDDGSGAAARFNLPLGIGFRGADLWVADNNNHSVRRITPAGAVATMAGAPSRTGSDNGPAATALFRGPKGLAIGAAPGVLFVADTLDATVRRIDPDPATGLAVAVTAVAGLGPFAGAADGQGAVARFRQPWGVSAQGRYVADTGNRTIRRMDAAGNVTTLAGSAGLSGLVDGAGAAARFVAPAALWEAPGGLVYVADTYAVRALDPATGTVTTVAGASTSGNADGSGAAARFQGVEGLCGDAAGNLYLADAGNGTLRKVLPTGQVTTLSPAGPGYQDGPLSGARFLRPTDVACAADGTLYVADSGNAAIRMVDPTGQVSTILGTPGVIGFAPMAAPSAIGAPTKLALEGASVLYVTVWNGVMRVQLR